MCLKLSIDMDDAALTAFGTGVGGPSRLFNRGEICDDHRTVYTGGVRVIACTLYTTQNI